MAAWSLIPTFSGFEYDMVHGMIGFDPLQPAAGYRTIWSLDSGWGTFAMAPDRLVLTVLAGELTLSSLRVPAACAGTVTAGAIGKAVPRDSAPSPAAPVAITTGGGRTVTFPHPSPFPAASN